VQVYPAVRRNQHGGVVENVGIALQETRTDPKPSAPRGFAELLRERTRYRLPERQVVHGIVIVDQSGERRFGEQQEIGFGNRRLRNRLKNAAKVALDV